MKIVRFVYQTTMILRFRYYCQCGFFSKQYNMPITTMSIIKLIKELNDLMTTFLCHIRTKVKYWLTYMLWSWYCFVYLFYCEVSVTSLMSKSGSLFLVVMNIIWLFSHKKSNCCSLLHETWILKVKKIEKVKKVKKTKFL